MDQNETDPSLRPPRRRQLSICVPTYNRPDLLARTLDSVVGEPSEHVEVVVSDNSTDAASAGVCERLLGLPSSRHRYVWNSPGVGLVGNLNRCIALASGEWILILHDDDYLLPGAVARLVRVTRAVAGECKAVLFGVNVVDGEGKLLKRQTFRRTRHMQPREALCRVMRDSSFVRPPAIVVRSEAYRELGGYAADMQGTNDIDMWSRLFSAFGVTSVAQTTAAYTVHSGALTCAVFEPGTIARLELIFDRVARAGVISEGQARRCQCDFFHQFILGGAYRRIREGDRAGASTVMELFGLPSVRRLGISPRWAPVRTAFALLTVRARSAPA